MKATAKELEFISQIKRDGSGVIEITNIDLEYFRLYNDKFDLYCLSKTHETFIAHGFNSFVVKLKK